MKVKVRGLDEFRRELKRIDRALGKELRQVHLKVAGLVSGRARAAAPGRTGQAIRPRATQKSAFVQVGSRPGHAIGTFMGAKRRFGWYAAGRYRTSEGRQFEPWIGNQWDPGDGAGGPYHIGPAIDGSIDEVIELYGDEIEELAAKAFPDRA